MLLFSVSPPLGTQQLNRIGPLPTCNIHMAPLRTPSQLSPDFTEVLSHIQTSWLKKCLNLYRNHFGDISNYCTERNPRTKLQEMSYHGAVYGPWRLESIGWCEAKNQSLSHLVCFLGLGRKCLLLFFS